MLKRDYMSHVITHGKLSHDLSENKKSMNLGVIFYS